MVSNKVLLNGLIEAARCLGATQDEHWEQVVQRYKRELEQRFTPESGQASDPRAAEILGGAVRDAAVECGIVRGDVDLSGPQLLMLVDDLKQLAKTA